jgi:hypothetical protein
MPRLPTAEPATPTSMRASALSCFGSLALLSLFPPSNSKSLKKPACNRYLPVFILASFADWIMGPYIYSMYEDYGFSVADIGLLFVVGFGSSMAFGTFCGGLSDRFARLCNNRWPHKWAGYPPVFRMNA